MAASATRTGSAAPNLGRAMASSRPSDAGLTWAYAGGETGSGKPAAPQPLYVGFSDCNDPQMIESDGTAGISLMPPNHVVTPRSGACTPSR
jgi:hypothetical protein